MTTYLASASGGGCSYNSSNTDEVTLENHYFQKQGENLVIDKKITLEKNEKWEDVKILEFWNPWRLTKEKISVMNYGVINCAMDFRSRNVTSYGPSLIAGGSHGSYYEMNFIGIVVLIVLILIINKARKK